MSDKVNGITKKKRRGLRSNDLAGLASPQAAEERFGFNGTANCPMGHGLSLHGCNEQKVRRPKEEICYGTARRGTTKIEGDREATQ